MSQIDRMVYEFLNSADVRAHLEEARYEFTMPEAAFIVFQSKRRTLSDKIAAWREIAATYPNCGMCPRDNMETIPNFKEFLEGCANEQERAQHSFIEQEPADSENAGYGYRYIAISSIRHADGKEREYESTIDQSNALFPSFDDCMNAVREELEYEPRFLSLTVTRYECGASADSATPRTTAAFDSSLSVVSIWQEREDTAVEQFEGMCFKFPLPFRRGDLLIDCCSVHSREPFVLDQIKLWSIEEMKDNGIFAHGVSDEEIQRQEKLIEKRLSHSERMEMGAYCIEASGRYGLYEDPLPLNLALDFEYFHGELSNECKILLPVSKFLYGECDIESLVNASIILSLESVYFDRKQALGQEYTKSYLDKLGIHYEDDSGASQR